MGNGGRWETVEERSRAVSNTRRVKHARAQYTYININTNININGKKLYYNYCTRSHPGRIRFLLGLSRGFRASFLSFVFPFFETEEETVRGE